MFGCVDGAMEGLNSSFQYNKVGTGQITASLLLILLVCLMLSVFSSILLYLNFAFIFLTSGKDGTVESPL